MVQCIDIYSCREDWSNREGFNLLSWFDRLLLADVQVKRKVVYHKFDQTQVGICIVLDCYFMILLKIILQ